MAVLKTDFANDIADIIVSDIQLKRATWYHFLGKTQGYEYGATLPEVIGSAQDEANIRNDSIYYKKVSSSAVQKVIKRVEWQENTVYSRWDHTRNMITPTGVYDKSFYVVTKGADQVYRVYKCLDNNENLYVNNTASHFVSGGSKIKPTFDGVEPVRFLETEHYDKTTGYPTESSNPNAVLGDGYMWKYMYTISGNKLRQFGNSTYIPVQKAISDSFYNRGAIENVIVLNSGSGYDSYDACQITVTDTGHTAGSGATVTISSVDATGKIVACTVQHVSVPGATGYTAGVKLQISSVHGVGAVLTPVLDGSGFITAITVTSGGYGYMTSDNVTASVGGARFGVAVAKNAGVAADGKAYVAGEILKVSILDPGIGYTSAPVLTVQNLASGLTPSGKFGNPTAIVSCQIYQNRVVNVLLEDPGQGYPSNNDTTIVATGDGNGAAFVPIVDGGRIVEVITENAGEGYTTISLSASTAATGVTPASFEPIINSQDFTQDQSYIEQLAVPGGLYAAKLRNPTTGAITKGTGYTDTQFVTVTIEGDGIGAEAVATVYDGEIVDVRFTKPGFGYTYANLTFTDSQRENANPALVAASGYAIIPPIGGHGSDAPRELGAQGVGVYAAFRISSTLNYIDQDYRLYGLLRGPKDVYNRALKVDEELSTYTIGINTSEVQLSVFDEKVLVMSDTQYGIQKFRVVASNTSLGQLIVSPLGDRNITPQGELFLEDNTLIRCTVVAVADSPIINRNSGEIVFYSYEQPFTFSENQGIIIKTFLNLSNTTPA